jgi:hypothetical protein
MITSNDRLQPMDEQEDHPIKVLIIAPLIMVSLPTVYSFFSTRGCFLRGGWSPSRYPPPLSLACGWPPGANGSLPFCRMAAPRLLGFKILRVQGKRDRTSHGSGLGRPAWADRPGPTSARFGRPFRSVGPYAFMYFSPSTFMILTMSSSRPRWRFSSHEVRSFTLQSPGVFLVALRSLPPLEVISSSSWTRTRLRKCSFELVANPSFMPVFSYINTTLPNACT